jgi:type IV pilus assembly protein PilQ
MILGFVLSGCANSQFAKKYNKPFKHNTPLIKKDMKALGKAEIAKTLEMGPKPVPGIKKFKEKEKRLLQKPREITC